MHWLAHSFAWHRAEEQTNKQKYETIDLHIEALPIYKIEYQRDFLYLCIYTAITENKTLLLFNTQGRCHLNKYISWIQIYREREEEC